MQVLLNHIESIVTAYQGHPPLSLFLKSYFKQHPKLGSRDRKALSEAVFIYYRHAPFFGNDPVSIPDVVAAGIRYSGTGNTFLKKIFAAKLNAAEAEQTVFRPGDIQFEVPVSEGITTKQWLASLLQQPQLFIRLRNNKEHVLKTLQANEIAFDTVEPGIKQESTTKEVDCLRLPNSTPIDKLLQEKDYVVQDWASQTSIYLLLSQLKQNPKKVWDVCSGAGGKSILLKDKLPSFELLATDIRESILHNLLMRFKQYSLKKPEVLVLDSSNAAEVSQQLDDRKFDLIICDVPCSGSGTWARTPEQFYFFKPEDLEKFRKLQYPIAYHAQKHLAEDGIFAYITCSVFKAENEEVTAQLLQQTGLELIHQQIIDGTEEQADGMFCAFFSRK